MHGNRLAHGAMTVIAISVPVAGMAAGFTAGSPGAASAAAPASQQKASRQVTYHLDAYQQKTRSGDHESFNQRAANYVKTLEGTPYRYGGSDRSGFDCSGLTQYVYRHLGKNIARTTDGQFRQFRRISKDRAWGGDLVFFHNNSDPNSSVYHVGVYEGGDNMVAASSSSGEVRWESFSWAGDTVTFGTITH